MDKGKAMFAVEVVAGAGAIAYLNHWKGAGELKVGAAANGSGGVPVDGLLGAIGVGYSLWKPSSKIAKHAMPIGLGFLSGFAYRTGAAAGDKAAQAAPASASVAGVTAARAPAQLGPAFRSWAAAVGQAQTVGSR